MHILFDAHVLGKGKSGLERYTTNIINGHLADNNIKLSLYLNKLECQNIQNFTQSYIPTYDHGLYRIIQGFQKAIEITKPDIVHVQNFGPIKHHLPLVTTVHDLCFLHSPNTFNVSSKLAFKLFLLPTLQNSSAIITPSRVVKNELINFYQEAVHKTFVVYEAADNVFYYEEPDKKQQKLLKNKYGIKEKYFLVVGSQKRKQVDLIHSAFTALTLQFPNLSLVCTEYDHAVIWNKQNQSQPVSVNDDDLRLLYNNASALVYFSSCEGFGLPLVEAMACGTPIICRDSPLFREICNNQVLYAVNSEDIYRNMSLVINNQTRDSFSQKSLQQSCKFSWKKAHQETLKVYRLAQANFRNQKNEGF